MAVDESIPLPTAIEITRFWQKVRKGPECWEWIGAKASGYGWVSIGGRQYGAHRVSVRIAGGSIPRGMWVCHRCDNHACVNPSHLFVGTPADNSADMIAKGRSRFNGPNKPRGERHHKAKLTEADVVSIREAVAAGEFTRAVGLRFGINGATVSGIARGKFWAHVGGPITSMSVRATSPSAPLADAPRSTWEHGE